MSLLHGFYILIDEKEHLFLIYIWRLINNNLRIYIKYLLNPSNYGNLT